MRNKYFLKQFAIFFLIPLATQSMTATNTNNMVINTKLIQFNESIDNAYNASIIEYGSGYLLIFRHDTENKLCACGYKQPQIKMVCLNKNFEQVTPIKNVEIKKATSKTNLTEKLIPFTPEDARIHSCRRQLFLTYNSDVDVHQHTTKSKTPWRRQMFKGKFDPKKAYLSDIEQIPSNNIPLTLVEKNWTPFEYPEGSGGLYYNASSIIS